MRRSSRRCRRSARYSRYFNPVEVLLVVGLVYFVLCTGLSSLVALLERGPAAGELTTSRREPTE
jgi:ABC-type amino acid transport system permease subunit